MWLVKVIIQEQCPACKNKFDSMIEFDHYNKNKSRPNNQKNAKSLEGAFNGNFTLGKLMQIISLIGGVSGKIGDKSVNLIVEQCKLMGLTKEDENTIYRIVEMVGQQDVSMRDVLITIYRFAKVLGIKDDVADMYYYKLMINSPNLPVKNNFDSEDIKEMMWEGT